MDKNKKVNKAMSTEESALLQEVENTIAKLKSASGAGTAAGEGEVAEGMTGQPPIETPEQISAKADALLTPEEKEAKKASDAKAAEDKKKKDEDAAKKVDKGVTATPGDGADANSDADERIMQVLSEVDEENIESVKKAIAAIKAFKANGSIQKTVHKSMLESPLMEMISGLTTVVKSMNDRIESSETALGNILSGLGIADQIKALPAQPVRKSEPIVDTDNINTINALRALVGTIKKTEDGGDQEPDNKVGQNYVSNGEIAHKNVMGVIGSMAARMGSNRPSWRQSDRQSE